MLNKIYVNNSGTWKAAKHIYKNTYKEKYQGSALFHVDCDKGYVENIAPDPNPTINFVGRIIKSTWGAIPGNVFLCEANKDPHQYLRVHLAHNLITEKTDFTLSCTYNIRPKTNHNYDIIFYTYPHGVSLWGRNDQLYLVVTHEKPDGSYYHHWNYLGLYDDYFPDKAWRHVALTWDYSRKEYTLYIQGAKVKVVRTTLARTFYVVQFVYPDSRYVQNTRFLFDPLLTTIKYNENTIPFVKSLTTGKGMWKQADRVYVNDNNHWKLVHNIW